METAPEALDFIRRLLRRPGMYVIGNHFEGVSNLMFGMKLSSQQAKYYDPDVARWDEFISYLAHKYVDRLRASVLPQYRSWFASDAEALEALKIDYAEFLSSRKTPELLVVNHFQAVLRRPAMYAKTWDEFSGMVRGIVAFAGRETHRSDVVQEWENFQRWVVQKHSNLIPNDDQGDVLNILRSQCDTDAGAFAMFGRLYREFMNA